MSRILYVALLIPWVSQLVTPAHAVDIVVQAEDFLNTDDQGSLRNPGFLVMNDDPQASPLGGETYITTGRDYTDNPPQVLATYEIDFPTTDPYHLYTHALAGEGSDSHDSFWLPTGFGDPAPGFVLQNLWSNVIGRVEDNYVWVNHTTNLSLGEVERGVENRAGPFTPASVGISPFVIGGREDEFRLDAFVFSTDDSLTADDLNTLVNGPPDVPPPTPISIPLDSRIRPAGHGLTGDGLQGRWWKRQARNNLLANAQTIVDERVPDATFLATQVDYARGDRNGLPWEVSIGEFLSPDELTFNADSRRNERTQIFDSVWAFNGAIDILDADDSNPTLEGIQVDFAVISDDASNLVIGGIEVLHNDGSHGFPGDGAGPKAVTFAESGLYSISVIYT